MFVGHLLPITRPHCSLQPRSTEGPWRALGLLCHTELPLCHPGAGTEPAKIKNNNPQPDPRSLERKTRECIKETQNNQPWEINVKTCIASISTSVRGAGEERTNSGISWQQRGDTAYFLSLLLHCPEGEDAPDLPWLSKGGSGLLAAVFSQVGSPGWCHGQAEQGSLLALPWIYSQLILATFCCATSVAVSSSFPIPSPMHIPVALS